MAHVAMAGVPGMIGMRSGLTVVSRLRQPACLVLGASADRRVCRVFSRSAQPATAACRVSHGRDLHHR
jgi:hypothetical protein